MLRIFLSLAIAAMLAGCGQDAPPATSVTIPPPPDATVQVSGKQAYDRACARCHDEGVDGAPKTGDREAWADRSWLWEAVLFEHAKSGYMTMPAKGGEETLDDTIVEMAAEYMLTKTYPDVMPSD
jgi:cytochrome c5